MFVNDLLHGELVLETAGELQGGKKIWLLAVLPKKFHIVDDFVEPYLLFTNSFSGEQSIKCCMTPIRVSCSNSLNLALKTCRRSWSFPHVGEIHSRLQEARATLNLANEYMNKLTTEAESLNKKILPDHKVLEFIEELIPVDESLGSVHRKNVEELRSHLYYRYTDAPDLANLPKSAYRLINSISDTATHAVTRKSNNFQGNIFAKTVEGNPLIDKAYEMLLCI